MTSEIAMPLLAVMAGLSAQISGQTAGITPPQPIVSGGQWTSDDDYPAEALRNREQGTTGVGLTVSASGRVTACRIVQSSGSTALDQATCRILPRQLRFKPARDASGKRIEGEFITRMNWKLPK